ncbi:MAG: hypothetical protein NUV31_07280 [Dehalococcoidales bacterium]|jgi:hypothetical protein|nr:hypothetical protein [Dehalococcoidales bacterium]
MEWLLFTYWLPPEPSRKRVFIWRQLKKIGALSTEGASWLLPKTESLLAAMSETKHTVEEMGGIANLYIASHLDEAQEQRAIARFRQERDNEYDQIKTECYKALKHIEREYQAKEFNFEEIEELEGDLEKIKRWFAEAKKRDFWEVHSRNDVEKLIGEVEARIAAFSQKTYDEIVKPAE